MISITANELITKGLSVLKTVLKDNDEAVISVRGKDKYVIVDLQKYARLREFELEIALLEARANVASGRINKDTVAEHMERASP